MPAARLGLGYSVDGVQRFIDLLGPQSVADLFMTARTFGAEEALRIGFVAAVEAPDRLHARVLGIASTIAANAPLTVRAVKLVLRSGRTRDEQALAAANQAVRDCVDSADYVEGQLAFREKRQPFFKGT